MAPCTCYNIEIRGDEYIHPWSPDVDVGVVEGLKEHVVKQEILSQAVLFFFLFVSPLTLHTWFVASNTDFLQTFLASCVWFC